MYKTIFVDIRLSLRIQDYSGVHGTIFMYMRLSLCLQDYIYGIRIFLCNFANLRNYKIIFACIRIFLCMKDFLCNFAILHNFGTSQPL